MRYPSDAGVGRCHGNARNALSTFYDVCFKSSNVTTLVFLISYQVVATFIITPITRSDPFVSKI